VRKTSSIAGLRPFALLALLATGGVAADAPPWRVAQGDVRVVCPLTVGGTFEARTASITGTLALLTARPAVFSGRLSVDLRTLDTGIGLRNDHLRNTYLEVGKGEGYDTAVLSDIRLADVDAESFQGRTGFTAVLLLHGAKKTVTGPAELRREGPSVRVTAGFPVVLADYGIAKPQYLGVGVKNEVQVKVSLVAGREAVPAGPQ
jgi:polyisoprenoid-binding protein YceI